MILGEDEKYIIENAVVRPGSALSDHARRIEHVSMPGVSEQVSVSTACEAKNRSTILFSKTRLTQVVSRMYMFDLK